MMTGEPVNLPPLGHRGCVPAPASFITLQLEAVKSSGPFYNFTFIIPRRLPAIKPSLWLTRQQEDILTNVLGLWWSLSPSDPSPTHKHTQPHPNNSPQGGQYLSLCLMNHLPSTAAGRCDDGNSGRQRREFSSVHLEVVWRDLGQGQTMPDCCQPSCGTFPSSLLPFFFFQWELALHYHALQGLSAPALYSFSRAARQISLHQDLLCALQSQRGGEHVCVCHLWVCLFFSSFFLSFSRNRGYFSLLWRILPLRSEEAGYLPDSDCAEVITVLYWKEGQREWGGLWRVSLAHFDRFSWKH